MSGDEETFPVEQNALRVSVLAVGQGDLGVSFVSSLQGLEDAGWGLVSSLGSIKKDSQGVIPVIGRNVCQQTLLARLRLRLLLLGWDHVRAKVVRFQHCKEV